MLFPVLTTANRWLDNSFEDFFNRTFANKAVSTVPSINVRESDKEYSLDVAAPGMTKEDFSINVTDDGNLVVKLERKNQTEEKKDDERYVRREFSYSSYQEQLLLPKDVDRNAITANMSDGVLHIVLPRQTKPVCSLRCIEIS